MSGQPDHSASWMGILSTVLLLLGIVVLASVLIYVTLELLAKRSKDTPGIIRITPMRSLLVNGILTPLATASPAGAITYLFTSGWLHGSWDIALSLVVLGFVAGFVVYKKKIKFVNVPVGSEGVVTVQGALVITKVYTAGDQCLVDGYDDMKIVEVRQKPYDPPAFEQMAGDNTSINVDIKLYLSIYDPVKHLLVSSDPANAIDSKSEDVCRLLVSQWANTSHLIAEQRNLLKYYLLLPANRSDPKHVQFRHMLENMRNDDTTAILDSGMNAIMAEAGEFSAKLQSLGYKIDDVDTQNVELSAARKSASEEAAAAKDKAEASKVKGQAMKELAESLKGTMPDDDIAKFVLYAFGGDVKLSYDHNTFELRDAKAVLDTFMQADPEKAAMIASAFTKAQDAVANTKSGPDTGPGKGTKK